jgi:hypothetical protein
MQALAVPGVKFDPEAYTGTLDKNIDGFVSKVSNRAINY